MNYIALICARGGSKGLPGKNIKPLAGVPLIGWSILVAKEIENISRIIVSTDSEEIAKIAKDYGAEVPFIRPIELAQDDSPEWAVWQHALNFLESEGEEVDGLVVIPTTAPLRDKSDITRCLHEYEKYNIDIVITVSEAHRNPYFNMIKLDRDGYASLVATLDCKVSNRQQAPAVYDMTTVAYVARPRYVRNNSSLFEGTVRSVEVPLERSLDIDTPFDFKLAEYLIELKQGGGK